MSMAKLTERELAEDFISSAQVAREVKCTRQWVSTLIKTGQLPSISVAGVPYVRKTDLGLIAPRSRKAQLA